MIYFYHSGAMPLFALTAFARNQRADVSQADRNGFPSLTVRLKEAYFKRSAS